MKLNELKRRMKENRINAAVIINLKNKDENLFYFANIEYEYAALVVTKNKHVLLVSEMEYESARKESAVKNIKKTKNIFEELSRQAKKAKTIGLNLSSVSVNELKLIKKYLKRRKIKDISKALYDLRSTKTSEEISRIKKACSVSDNALNKAIKNFKKFKTEMDVKEFIENEFKKNKCMPAFDTIVASGKNTSIPHYTTGRKKIGHGFCMIDMGAKYKGYCSDMTRMLYIGAPSKKEKEFYDKMLSIQCAAINSAKENMKLKKLDAGVRKKLGKLSKYFVHSTGHGVGINVHESPKVSPYSNEGLKNGMVFTIEPGIYIKNKFGIRIEDTVLLKNKKAVSLTKTKKSLAIIN